MTENADRGQEVIPLPPLDGDVRIYLETLRAADLTPVHIERVVVHDTDRVAGTLDRILRAP
jgi:hypothetical protein